MLEPYRSKALQKPNMSKCCRYYINLITHLNLTSDHWPLLAYCFILANWNNKINTKGYHRTINTNYDKFLHSPDYNHVPCNIYTSWIALYSARFYFCDWICPAIRTTLWVTPPSHFDDGHVAYPECEGFCTKTDILQLHACSYWMNITGSGEGDII